jgi:asparagine synthase (glutamine-hydrolysing)
VGTARLDNRAEVLRWVGRRPHDQAPTDVELATEAVAARGARCISRLLGDFALVFWDAASQTLTAARDALGGKTLFVASRRGIVIFGSRSAPLGDDGLLDLDTIASFLVASSSPSERTIFAGVSRVPAGSIVSCHAGSMVTSTFWSAAEFGLDESNSGHTQVEVFRELFFRAVKLRLTQGNDTWAQLSGGLDSSSIVSVAQTLASAGDVSTGVEGTVTLVDTLSGPGEEEYSDAVVRRFPVRNEKIVDYWAWQEDGSPPPLTDRPVPLYPFWAQTRRMSDVVRRGGGRVLLSGDGSDFYLAGNPYFFADLVARGRLADACRGMAHWSAVGRTSFWRFAFDNACVPLLPSSLRRGLARDRVRAPDWLRDDFVKRWNIGMRVGAAEALDSRRGHKYAGVIAFAVAALQRGVDHEVIDDDLEVRYPFLYRPLVEHSLRLPPPLRTQPLARKWVLRESMRGVLPERVRERTGKGTIGARIPWSFVRERARITELLDDPILGDLGCIDVRRARAAAQRNMPGDSPEQTLLLCTLSLETWLRVRSGRWTARQ